MNTKRIIRNMSAYNSMLQEIKEVMATETIESYKIEEDRNVHIYGGTMCYDHYSFGAVTYQNETVFSFSYENTFGTISSEGVLDEEEISCISKDIALRAIKLALREAFSLPEFVGNDGDCPSDDDGTWWNNHRLVPSSTTVVVNDHEWIVYFKD